MRYPIITEGQANALAERDAQPGTGRTLWPVTTEVVTLAA
jgi:hypothetical protein